MTTPKGVEAHWNSQRELRFATDKHYKYNSKIGLSIQYATSTQTLNEIINQCDKNNINYEFKIKLYDK